MEVRQVAAKNKFQVRLREEGALKFGKTYSHF